MNNGTELKEKACKCIDAHRDEIINLGEDIRTHPEMGFKEFRTAGIVSEHFRKLQIPHESELAITGVKGLLRGRKNEITVGYLGELDSVLVQDHPDADPQTGAAHACGHHAQIANLLALAYGLVDSDIMSQLDGNIVLMAVPAEEYVELAWRREQKQAGLIEFLSGKPELVRIGAFDDVQIAMMTHQSSWKEKSQLAGVAGPCNGCIVKQIRYLGRAAHAGAAPNQGINALKAAMLGLQAIDANRETFLDNDHIRVHPIITKGGELVNVVPREVCMETYVRGASLEAITDAEAKVDRALRAGAMAMGAKIEIDTVPGYLPRLKHDPLADAFLDNARLMLGEEAIKKPGVSTGSTDMGDISQLMPAIEINVNGSVGHGHGADYFTRDPDTAYILPAKLAAMTIIDLLYNNAGKGREVIENSPPAMTREEYWKFMRDSTKTRQWDYQYFDSEEKK